MNWVAATVLAGAAGAGATAVEDGTGAFAETVTSQTSSGSTSESSRKILSHATRRVSAALSAVTLACLSAARAFWLWSFEVSGVGIACNTSCSDDSSACLSLAVPLAERNVAEKIAVIRTAAMTGARTIHCDFGGPPRRASSFGRRLIARMSVLDPEADCDRERPELLGLANLLPELHSQQRIADRGAHAHQLLQLPRRPAEVRGAAGDHDLADAQRSGLVLVELERGDELSRKGLELATNRLARTICLFLVETLRDVRPRQRELALDRLGLRRRAVQLAGNGDVKRLPAPVEHTRELAGAAIRDGEGRAGVADRDDDERRVRRAGILRLGLAERAQERERLEVDPRQPHAGLLAGRDVTVDQLAIGDHEQDPANLVAVVVEPLAEDVVIEYRLLDRNRERLLGAEADGVFELLRVVDAGDLEDPDADAVVRDAQAHALARKLVLAEERLQGLGEELGLTQLAADDDAPVEVLSRDLDQFVGAVVDDPRGRQL